MTRTALLKNRTWILLIAGMLAAAPALADRPSWASGGKGDGGDQDERHEGKKSKHGHGKHAEEERGGGRHEYFDEHRRAVVRDYYAEEFRGGRCPPGLAKKHNGCMPPGQAKKWKLGRPLPRDVVYYDLPPAVVTQIGPPPEGHRYVRVANDILLMTIGTGMIVDAIEDLNRR